MPHKLRNYLEYGPWPLMSSGKVKNRACGDNYGDAECPFCDYVFRSEGQDVDLGDKCRKCGAIVTGLRCVPDPSADAVDPPGQ